MTDYETEIIAIKKRFEKAIVDENPEHVAMAEQECRDWALNFVASIKHRNDIDEKIVAECLADLHDFVAEKISFCKHRREEYFTAGLKNIANTKAMNEYFQNSIIQHDR